MYRYKGISHLSKSEQKEVLVEAKNVAFTKLGLRTRSVQYLVLSILFGVIVGIIAWKSMNVYSAPLLSILLANWAYQISNGSLIAQGLECVLEKNHKKFT